MLTLSVVSLVRRYPVRTRVGGGLDSSVNVFLLKCLLIALGGILFFFNPFRLQSCAKSSFPIFTLLWICKSNHFHFFSDTDQLVVVDISLFLSIA